MSRREDVRPEVVADYALTLARLDAAATCSAAEKSQAILAQLEQALASLASLDETSRQAAEAQLLALARTALAAVAEMHTEISLPGVGFPRTEKPPTSFGEKLGYWLHTKFLPWWQDDTL
ncbi:hypothetical protein ACI8AC_12700 [Geodermatophilus sp. SYSU D00758]